MNALLSRAGRQEESEHAACRPALHSCAQTCTAPPSACLIWSRCLHFRKEAKVSLCVAGFLV